MQSSVSLKNISTKKGARRTGVGGGSEAINQVAKTIDFSDFFAKLELL